MATETCADRLIVTIRLVGPGETLIAMHVSLNMRRISRTTHETEVLQVQPVANASRQRLSPLFRAIGPIAAAAQQHMTRELDSSAGQRASICMHVAATVSSKDGTNGKPLTVQKGAQALPKVGGVIDQVTDYCTAAFVYFLLWTSKQLASNSAFTLTLDALAGRAAGPSASMPAECHQR